MVILNDILDFSKLEANKIDLETIPCKLSEIIHNIMSLFEFAAKENSTLLNYSISEDLSPALLGDPTRIYQIISNLVSNAVKFTSRGKVSLKLSIIDENDSYQRVKIDVEDTGIGIVPNKINDLFTAFEQLEQSTTREYGGTGLGLAISKRLIDLMNGTIEVNSNDQGSCFSVTLELKKSFSELPSTMPKHEVKPHNSLRILAVDDNIINQTLIKTYINKLGYKCTLAENGLEAYELYKKEKFDLIFMDIQMPIMSGLEATEKIRLLERQEHYKPSYIIALTAHAYAEEKLQSLEAGMNDHLVKPCKLSDLQKCLINYTSYNLALS